MVCVIGTWDIVLNCQASNLSFLFSFFFALTPSPPWPGLRNKNIPNILEEKLPDREVGHQKREETILLLKIITCFFQIIFLRCAAIKKESIYFDLIVHMCVYKIYTVNSYFSEELIFYKVTVNTELENTEPLLLEKIQDWVPMNLWSQHFHHLTNV